MMEDETKKLRKTLQRTRTKKMISILNLSCTKILTGILSAAVHVVAILSKLIAVRFLRSLASSGSRAIP